MVRHPATIRGPDLLTELGAFAPSAGRRVLASRLAGWFAAAAALSAMSRLVGYLLADPGSSTRDLFSDTLGMPAVILGLVALSAGLVGRYQAQARGHPGERLGRVSAIVGVSVAIVAFLGAAQENGTLRLDRFGRAYFDLDILTALPSALARGLRNTLAAAFVAEALAIVVGLVVATLAISDRRRVRWPAVAYTDLVRGLPLLVLTSLIYFGSTRIGLRLTPFLGVVVALAVNASAYCAEIFRAGIQAVPSGQMEAARSLGMPRVLAMRHVVLPQAVRNVIPPLVSEFIALIKDTAIVFAIVGFTTQTADVFGIARSAAASTFSPTPYMAAAFTYLLFTVPLARMVGRLETRMRARTA